MMVAIDRFERGIIIIFIGHVVFLTMAGLEIRILTMPVKRKINTTFYCFAKFSKIHAGQAHLSAGQ